MLSRLRESGGSVQNDGPDAANMPATGIDLLGWSGYYMKYQDINLKDYLGGLKTICILF